MNVSFQVYEDTAGASTAMAWWIIGLLALIEVVCVVGNSKVLARSASEVIYPERLHARRGIRDLSTATEKGHEDEASFSLKAFQKDIILDAKRNKELIHPSFSLRHYAKDGSELLSEVSPDHCHYQGSIRGVPDSLVVLHTCSGLKGIIDDGENTYNIEPHDDSAV
ncbi:predicted protein [Nematostella vectensis]|uniref:Peptidase M12B propeptide domain-containing protein n=1 Tax=Nematostella vectensis TaxID=45351 RepID=A7RL86_NEMVE|nr:predicted protein [Nematostella vectensis]|eukprot:XP_001639949.1 predicted protein [Nematostella vectensis]